MRLASEIKQYLEKRLIKENAFWSFEKKSCRHLSDWHLIKYTLLHLDIEDVKLLFQLYPKRLIKQVWIDELVSQGDYLLSMNLCYALLCFGAKKPRQYVRAQATRRLNKILNNERGLS